MASPGPTVNQVGCCRAQGRRQASPHPRRQLERLLGQGNFTSSLLPIGNAALLPSQKRASSPRAYRHVVGCKPCGQQSTGSRRRHRPETASAGLTSRGARGGGFVESVDEAFVLSHGTGLHRAPRRHHARRHRRDSEGRQHRVSSHRLHNRASDTYPDSVGLRPSRSTTRSTRLVEQAGTADWLGGTPCLLLGDLIFMG
jgi:hypothetical protein